jgi:hypothetical protein
MWQRAKEGPRVEGDILKGHCEGWKDILRYTVNVIQQYLNN